MKTHKPKGLKLTHPRWRPIVKLLQEGLSVQDVMLERNERESTVRAVQAEIQRREKP